MLATINFIKNLQGQSAGRVYHSFYRETVLVQRRNGRRLQPCRDCTRLIGNRQPYYSCPDGASICPQCVADFAPIEAWSYITLESAPSARPIKLLHQDRWVFELQNQFYLPMPNGRLDCFASLESIPAPADPSTPPTRKEQA